MEGKIIYIGEYSNDQKAYNITTLEEAVKINLEMMSNGIFNGYVPICYGFSREEVRNKLDEIQNKIGRP